MFIGHFAAAFAAKRAAPTVSLGTLVLSAQLPDVLWPTLVIASLERFEVRPGATAVTPLEFVSYPYSHSLLAVTGWAMIAAALYWWMRANRAAALMVAGLVLSHWLLDAATHKPDMPLAFGDTRVGLGLWNSVPATIVIEGIMLVVGLALYTRATRPRDRIGRLALWGFVAFITIVYLATMFGPMPPDMSAVAWSAQAIWLLVIWGYWIDRHRVARLGEG